MSITVPSLLLQTILTLHGPFSQESAAQEEPPVMAAVRNEQQSSEESNARPISTAETEAITRLPLSEDDAFELHQRRLAEAVQQRVEKVLVERYTWLGIITVVITSGFITITIRSMLTDARAKLGAAEQMQEATTKRLLKASDATSELLARTEASTQRFEKAEEKADQRFSELVGAAVQVSEKLSMESERSLQLSEDVRREVASLSGVVHRIVAEQQGSKTQQAELNQRLEEINASLRKSEEDIRLASTKSDLLKYSVALRRMPGFSHVMMALGQAGFSPLLVDPKSTDTDYSTILVGRNVPVEVARSVLAPALQHMEFSRVLWSHTWHSAITLGYGATTRILESPEWEKADFEKLVAPDTSQKGYEALLAEKAVVDSTAST